MGRPAWADPEAGEGRPLTRDADRVYTVVAGEADAAATVTNPANLGYLEGVNGIIDIAYTARAARRRGSGVGVFLGVPLPWRILGLGAGFQFLDPRQPDSARVTDEPVWEAVDEPYGKVSFALAVPLVRWVRGLSVGLAYSRLVSARNLYADDLNQVDLAVSYWFNRFLALGVVGRVLNQPEHGSNENRRQEPMVLDPEIALRPFGTRVLELAVGARAYPRGVPSKARLQGGLGRSHVEPRGRILINTGGLRFFAELEGYRDYPTSMSGAALETRSAVRMQAGLEFNFSHFSFGGGPVTTANEEDVVSLSGGVARLRISHERYPALVVPRARRVTRIKLASFSGDRGMWHVVEQIDRLAGNGAAILLETAGMSLGYAQLEEVREAIRRARIQGTRTVVYMDGGGIGAYFLAASADRIIVHPGTPLNVVGMASRTIYYQELLAKLGARGDFLRIDDYKGWPEIIERSSASDLVAQQRRLLHGDVWNHVLRSIALDQGRDPLAVKEWIDEAPLSAERAIELGMVDASAYPDELDDALEVWLGKPVRIELARPPPEHAVHFGAPAHVAVLLIEGDLTDGESLEIPILGKRLAGAATLTKVVEGLRKNSDVKAVVVRIDSGGGMESSAAAIARELDLLRKEKPVVISMGRSCASGGYYIATAGQHIFSDATTVTGSIGIFYPKMDLSGTAAMFGLGIDEEGFGDHALMSSWWKPYTEGERAAAARRMEHLYDQFVGRVANARSLSASLVRDELAGGRVWSGARAIELGLADTYGGLREAIIRARLIAGLEPLEGEVRLYPEPVGVLANLKRLFGVRLPLDLISGALSPHGRAQARSGRGADVRSPLPAAVMNILRQLPAVLWLLERPEPLAMDAEPVVIE